jgi:hypothetical protein
VGKSFKLYGVWQPVFFHGNRSWIEKIAGNWSLSGVLNVHSGFPWSPIVPVIGGSLYCATCGYSTLFPAAYLWRSGDKYQQRSIQNCFQLSLGGHGILHDSDTVRGVEDSDRYFLVWSLPPALEFRS